MAGAARSLVVVSLDGLASPDLADLRQLPTFRWILDRGAHCPEVRGVYPTQTYPLHASVVTGCAPLRHGVGANTLFQPGRENPDWHWYRRSLRVPPLYEVAQRQGLRTGTLLWPGAGRAHLRYSIPEIRKLRRGQSFLWLLLSGGTPLFIVAMFLRFLPLVRGLDYTHLDNLTTAVAGHLLRRSRTELLMLHLLHLDGTRHKHGFRGEAPRRVLAEEDRRLAAIVEAIRSGRGFEETALVVFGDHAYIDVSRHVHLNTALLRAGLVEADERGRVRSWRAWANTCEGSARIHLRDPAEGDSRRRLLGLLEELSSGPQAPVEAVYPREALAALGAEDSADYMVEARPGCCFLPELSPEVIVPVTAAEAVHGYRPDRPNYSSLFLAVGAGVRAGAATERMDIVDIGPTLAQLLGLELPQAEGMVRRELLA